MKNSIVRSSLISLLLLGILGFAFITAAEADQVKPPVLKLTVEQSPLAIYPPFMIYTAQLSHIPETTTAVLKADFYNIVGPIIEPLPTDIEASEEIAREFVYLGSAPVDKAGKAVLSRQMKAGDYVAVARVVVRPYYVVWSNRVPYAVK